MVAMRLSLPRLEQPVGDDQIALALDGERVEIGDERPLAELIARAPADHDLARLRDGLQPRGEVRRVADCREAPLLRAADVADHGGARVDAGPEPRPVRVRLRDSAPGPLEAERGACGPG